MTLAFWALIFSMIFTSAVQASGPFCPSAPPFCSFKMVQSSLDDLKERKFLYALKSPDEICKGHLEHYQKNPRAFSNALQQLAFDEKFTDYVTPQIASCLKQSDGGASKAELLGRYAYVQKRLDNHATELAEYLAFADNILEKSPLSSLGISSAQDCQKPAPEFAQFSRSCQALVGDKCFQQANASSKLVKNFLEDYNSTQADGKNIPSIERELAIVENEFEKQCDTSFASKALTCSTEFFGFNGIEQCIAKMNQDVEAKVKAKKNVCEPLVNKRAGLALRLKNFYSRYPWAQQDEFKSDFQGRGRSLSSATPERIEAALKKQIATNVSNVRKEFREMQSASRCLLRDNCSVSFLNETLEKTQALNSEYQGDPKKTSLEVRDGKVGASLIIQYNNCADDYGVSQRITASTLWSSSLTAATMFVTAGGSVLASGLTAGGKTLRAAAGVGSRLAQAGSQAVNLSAAIDLAMAADGVSSALTACSKIASSEKAVAVSTSNKEVCSNFYESQREFQKGQSSCVTEMALALGTLGSSGVSAVAASKLKSLSNVSSAKFNSIEISNKAQQALKSGAPASEIRAMISSLDDVADGGKARIEIAESALGRKMSKEEREWLIKAHSTSAGQGYKGPGSGSPENWSVAELREKLKGRMQGKTPEERAKIREETRRLIELGLLGGDKPLNKEQMASLLRKIDELEKETFGISTGANSSSGLRPPSLGEAAVQMSLKDKSRKAAEAGDAISLNLDNIKGFLPEDYKNLKKVQDTFENGEKESRRVAKIVRIYGRPPNQIVEIKLPENGQLAKIPVARFMEAAPRLSENAAAIFKNDKIAEDAIALIRQSRNAKTDLDKAQIDEMLKGLDDRLDAGSARLKIEAELRGKGKLTPEEEDAILRQKERPQSSSQSRDVESPRVEVQNSSDSVDALVVQERKLQKTFSTLSEGEQKSSVSRLVQEAETNLSGAGYKVRRMKDADGYDKLEILEFPERSGKFLRRYSRLKGSEMSKFEYNPRATLTNDGSGAQFALDRNTVEVDAVTLALTKQGTNAYLKHELRHARQAQEVKAGKMNGFHGTMMFGSADGNTNLGIYQYSLQLDELMTYERQQLDAMSELRNLKRELEQKGAKAVLSNEKDVLRYQRTLSDAENSKYLPQKISREVDAQTKLIKDGLNRASVTKEFMLYNGNPTTKYHFTAQGSKERTVTVELFKHEKMGKEGVISVNTPAFDKYGKRLLDEDGDPAFNYLAISIPNQLYERALKDPQVVSQFVTEHMDKVKEASTKAKQSVQSRMQGIMDMIEEIKVLEKKPK